MNRKLHLPKRTTLGLVIGMMFSRLRWPTSIPMQPRNGLATNLRLRR